MNNLAANRSGGTLPGWMNWRNALILIGVSLIARLIYLRWLTPYELVGDEAYYWVQSQHLDWSYSEKGPLLPWAMALSCKVFGNVAWAVRLPVVIGSAIAAMVVGRMTLSLSRNNQTAAWIAVVFFLLTPAFHANAQLSTQDGLVIPLWAILSAIGLRIIRKMEAGIADWIGWMLFGVAMGVGMLLKQSILLFAMSLLVYVVTRHRNMKWWRTFVLPAIASIAVFAIVILPIVIWEHVNGWPLLEHTMGHLGFQGDRPEWTDKGNALGWFANTVGSFVGAIGPGLLGLMIAVTVLTLRRKKGVSQAYDSIRPCDSLWLLCAAWPSVLFYFALSLTKPVVPNWPLPSVVPLIPLIAILAAEQLGMREVKIAALRAARTTSKRIKKPENWFSRIYGLIIPYGVVAAILISFPNLLTHLPILSDRAKERISTRYSGSVIEAEKIRKLLLDPATAHAAPVIVTSGYQHASLITFYLEQNAITITSAGKALAARHSGYDYWATTKLDAPAMLGRSWMIVDDNAREWNSYFKFDTITPMDAESTIFLATDFAGLHEKTVNPERKTPGVRTFSPHVPTQTIDRR